MNQFDLIGFVGWVTACRHMRSSLCVRTLGCTDAYFYLLDYLCRFVHKEVCA